MLLSLQLKNSDQVNIKVKVAFEFLDRLVGLMFKKEVKNADGLLIKSCNSIHTFFMKFPIHVIFLDKNYRIVKIIYSMGPWRMTLPYLKASQVLELDARRNWEILKDLKKGDELEEVCIN